MYSVVIVPQDFSCGDDRFRGVTSLLCSTVSVVPMAGQAWTVAQRTKKPGVSYIVRKKAKEQVILVNHILGETETIHTRSETDTDHYSSKFEKRGN